MVCCYIIRFLVMFMFDLQIGDWLFNTGRNSRYGGGGRGGNSRYLQIIKSRSLIILRYKTTMTSLNVIGPCPPGEFREPGLWHLSGQCLWKLCGERRKSAETIIPPPCKMTNRYCGDSRRRRIRNKNCAENIKVQAREIPYDYHLKGHVIQSSPSQRGLWALWPEEWWAYTSEMAYQGAHNVPGSQDSPCPPASGAQCRSEAGPWAMIINCNNWM